MLYDIFINSPSALNVTYRAAYTYYQWPVTYLITLSMSCQPGPPRARHGQ